MRTFLFFFLLFFTLVLNSYSLPKCQGSDAEWNNCIGKKIYELKYDQGVAIYDGEWKNGKEHGHGRLSWPKVGGEYVGEFKDGIRSGFGHYSFSGGSSYSGEQKIIEGYPYYHGKGTYTNQDGSRRAGYWEKGLLVKGIDGPEGYIGEFKNNLKHGIGTMGYPTGAKYKGAWKKGERHGAGVYR